MPDTPADTAPEAATVRLHTVFPTDAFDPQVEGAPVITGEGTVVPADLEKPIREAAKGAAVTIRKG